MPRTKSSARWLRQHFDDQFVKRAQKEGYRSRAVYKLKEIDERDRLFRAGMTVIDLGAAPGGWSQYAVERVGAQGRICALDIAPIAPISGVEVIQGDFTDSAVLDLLIARVPGQRADLVISDLAPNISGIAAADQAQSMNLAECVRDFATRVLAPGGSVVIKVFQGAGYDKLHKDMRTRFDRLLSRKPKASRAQSREIYLLGKGFSGRTGAVVTVGGS